MTSNKRKFPPVKDGQCATVGATLSTPDAALLVCKFPRLSSLCVGWLSAHTVEVIAKQSTLTSLTLWNQEPSAESTLGSLTSLCTLSWHAKESSVTDVLEEIRDMSRLQRLHLAGQWLRHLDHGSSWEPLKCMPDLCHLQLEFATASQLEPLLASAESNITQLDVHRSATKQAPNIRLSSLLTTKVARLEKNRAHIDKVLVSFACAQCRGEMSKIPVDLLCLILKHWAYSRGFYGQYQRSAEQVEQNFRRVLSAAWRMQRKW